MVPDSQKLVIVTQTSQMQEAVKSSVREIAYQLYCALKDQWASGGTAEACQTEFFDPDSGEEMLMMIGRKPNPIQEQILRNIRDGQ